MITHLAERLVASLRCGVVAVDNRGLVTALNRPAADILSVDPEPSMGRDCREVFAHCPALPRLLLDALDRDTLPDRAELELDLGPSQRALIGFSLSRMADDDGAVLGSALFFKDLTLVEEERERQALRNRLASLGEMAAQLAHEIRNRLGGIRLFVGLARRRAASDPQTLEYLDRAEGELLAANGKMTEVLDFVRPVRLAPVPADLADLCRRALEATLARYPEANVEVRWDPLHDAPPVAADPARLVDALANLFANAVEAGAGRLGVRIRAEVARGNGPTAGEPIPGLRLHAAPGEARLCAEISDDGPGMAPEVLRRVFHPFFTTKETGTGLGVPAAQKILDTHGGSLDVRSEPGRGTTFVVTVPCACGEESDG
ncbi:MAG: PAS domain-containing protein [Deltaproteobacteria bacterium]|nr:PAS domain-containing protein [Deltaproteobacteria bacterium]